MTVDVANVQTAIVLQGGGALGAYEFGVLRALYEQRPGFRPAAVAGISIGAITAAVLGGARDDPIAAVDTLWRDKLTVLPPIPAVWLPNQVERSLSFLGNPGMYRLRPEFLMAPWAATSVYDTAPLRRTLAELVDLDTLNSGGTRVIVGAVGVGTAEMTYFDNRRPGRLTLDHVVASGSLPPSFPMTRIDSKEGSRWYWDGGLFSNTPLSPAINALEEAGGGDPSVLRELIVVELFPMEAPIPATMPDVFERMVQLQYASRLKLDEKFFDRIDRVVDLLDRIDRELPPDSAVRRDPIYRELRGYRKIDRFHVLTSTLPPELSKASDFSRASIEARIRAGYDDAVAQGIGRVDVGGPRRVAPVDPRQAGAA